MAGWGGVVGAVPARRRAKCRQAGARGLTGLANPPLLTPLPFSQVRSAAEEYSTEFEAKDAVIAALTAEAAAARASVAAEIEALRTAMEAEVAASTQAMHRRVDEAVAEAEAKAAGLRDAREKNVHFSARVVALNSRVAALQKAAREGAGREREMAAELEAMRCALAASHGTPRSPRAGLAAENGGSALSPMSPRTAAGWAALTPDQEAALGALCAAAVPRRLPIVNIQHGATPADSVGLPFAAWLLGECMLTWAADWRPPQVDAASARLRDAVLAAADAEGLGCQAYWLSSTLALGALLKASRKSERWGCQDRVAHPTRRPSRPHSHTPSPLSRSAPSGDVTVAACSSWGTT